MANKVKLAESMGFSIAAIVQVIKSDVVDGPAPGISVPK